MDIDAAVMTAKMALAQGNYSVAIDVLKQLGDHNNDLMSDIEYTSAKIDELADAIEARHPEYKN